MGKLSIDIVATPVFNNNVCIDLLFEDGSRFYDTDHGIDFDLVIKEGPGGGWPNIDLRGSKEAVRAWLEANEWEDIDWMMEDWEE